MGLKTQQWVPDTHPAYKIDEEWFYPDEPEGGWPDPENIPPPEFVRCARVTKDGVDLESPDIAHALIRTENQTKNRALAALEAALPNIVPVWVFGEADGVVGIVLPGATPPQMAAAEAALAEFGAAVTLA
jgi:hypothetical protein